MSDVDSATSCILKSSRACSGCCFQEYSFPWTRMPHQRIRFGPKKADSKIFSLQLRINEDGLLAIHWNIMTYQSLGPHNDCGIARGCSFRECCTGGSGSGITRSARRIVAECGRP
ncbi:uncharacterized protein LOC116843744 [Odontomachus brunneus]|uniref:uncharacterized protein LOC116843744 n=1 Tax=Odontomachus brunneus TaxID=486640 RepID=UPI0013F2AA76|nr:uncharacterized protein LOC116843744 [Odontomachus brunneus]XP_032670351.1 uncharacterized protein LOC116843744 [Odontomachus brunneus]XP_032670352.1 uncharacterized protein LOC116843744 [Odontomachus brunneus]XP_032670353.1 uncharacterized protein LOC116843744 [Odontomachus brunneus]XP_032670354.1 uncharacterized protein LOC116843744 [Odontomachus brunneus]